MPGERRGGRTRGTPNQRTILVDRILAVLAGCPAASLSDRLAMLVNDPELPAEIRAAVAQRAFPDRTRRARPQRRAKSERGEPASSATAQPVEAMSEAALEALIGIVCDPNASAEARRKVAVKLAIYLLPQRPVSKRWRAVPDKHGFVINGERAREYRKIDVELHKLERNPNRDLAEIAQKIGRLEKRKDAILKRLVSPCPSRYGQKEFAEDYIQLLVLKRKRELGIALTTEEDYEEAHRLARFDCYKAGPEQTLRRYRGDLEAKDLCFRKSRFYKDGLAAPLSRKERNKLRLLRCFYPPLENKSHQAVETGAESDDERYRHPFQNAQPDENGNLWPPPQLLDDDSDPGPPPYTYCFPGHPPIISDMPPDKFPRHMIIRPGQPTIFTHKLPEQFKRQALPPDTDTTPSGT
jgi:hypothetical protein